MTCKSDYSGMAITATVLSIVGIVSSMVLGALYECAYRELQNLKIEAAKKSYAEFVYDLEKRQTVFKWKESN